MKDSKRKSRSNPASHSTVRPLPLGTQTIRKTANKTLALVPSIYNINSKA